MPAGIYFYWREKNPSYMGQSLRVKAQTSMLSIRDELEYCNFACCNGGYNTFQKVNNKGVDGRCPYKEVIYCNTCVKRTLKNRQNKDLNDKW